ncbi:squalene monooxygenase-like isoform X1 [Latimeria chalumnae]|nr:PREDICTED: squalene monooxygenase-like isoform X1 [Latimeria chalumnae]|eukprot:XP_005998749.1 PREDICTED: squalene monooxygenase-like isoform X1 [Latimeria chalumnae]
MLAMSDLWGFTGHEVWGVFVMVSGLCLLLPVYYWYSAQSSLSSAKERKFKKASRSKRTHTSESFQEDPDIIIVGAGVLGATMATLLAQDGRKVVLIERDMTPPDRFAGEWLTPGTLHTLKEMGLEEVTESLNGAQLLVGFTLHAADTNTHIEMTFPLDGSGQVQKSKTLRNGDFVAALRKAAMEEPRVTIIEGVVTNLLEEGDRITGVEYKVKGSAEPKEVFASLTVVADGQYSNFRNSLISSKYTIISQMLGVILQDCPEMRNDWAMLVVGDQNLFILYPISSNETRVLVDIQGGIPKNFQQYLIETVSPQLPDPIKDAFLKTVQSDRLKTVPVGYLGSSPMNKPGVLILGDAYSARHPVLASGMAVAMKDISIWRGLLKNIVDLYDDNAVLQAKKKFRWSRNSHSFVANVFTQFLFHLYTTREASTLQLRALYFDYFKSGQSGPDPLEMMMMLSTSPWTLLKHLLATAHFVFWFAVKSAPWYLKPLGAITGARLLYRGATIVFPLMLSELQ